MKPLPVTFALIDTAGKILMQHRDDGNGKKIPYPNTWCIPGGEREDDEKPIETTIREAYEEYRISISKNDCRLVCVYDHDGQQDDHVYVCTIEKQEPEMHEGDDMAFMTIDEIKLLELAWEQEKITLQLEKYLKNKYYSTFE